MSAMSLDYVFLGVQQIALQLNWSDISWLISISACAPMPQD